MENELEDGKINTNDIFDVIFIYLFIAIYSI